MHKLASSTLIDEDILVIDLSSSSPSPTSSTPGQKGTPLRPVFCLKNRDAIKKMEEREDCFILDFDPDHHHHGDDATLNVSINLDYVEDDASPDISIVGEKGQVACRDYPHSRHVCVKYPFGQTPHDSYCHLCYCFVCDVAAPCKNWTGASGHCHAIDNDAWRLERELLKKSRKMTPS
ncbi:hypothetical protein ACH5RR_019872 [Cinchona calisaya]|uniref:Uncharacterized protein n=1 Tax=Cinchona calisaya TaxID=153742 RepID=A0ABD2ZRU5_9GENT